MFLVKKYPLLISGTVDEWEYQNTYATMHFFSSKSGFTAKNNSTERLSPIDLFTRKKNEPENQPT